ncbi:HlyD family type I secretion periplasmic adaptor subunit [Salinarimonas chemoclinalis]|uniref:HlyD family type I secretion periplasmic adaptor subunit n=1 Tax=Salinarimonas chemoclinalis TaxID=3241599 RepID=UPI003556BCF2
MSPTADRVVSPTLHLTILGLVAVFATAVTVSILLEVEIVARGQGRVIPLSRVQVIEPEFDGRIAAIAVENGQRVAAGEVLVAFDSTDAQAELARREAEDLRLRIERARIDAALEAASRDPAEEGFVVDALTAFVPPDGDRRYAREQSLLLEAELEELSSAARRTDARMAANARTRAVLQANAARVDAALETQDERLAASQELLERGTTSRLTHLDVLDESTRLAAERRVLEREAERIAATAAEIAAERSALFAGVRARLTARRADIEARLAALSEELVQARRRRAAMTLTAPVGGVVDQLRVFTVGGVAQAGEELMRVVPTADAPEIEAAFPNIDAGFLEPGQRAIIRLDAYPTERFGYVSGEVRTVSADAVEVDGAFVFVTRITPDTTYLEAPLGHYPLRPGMTATVDVVTGERRLISYFFAPIVETVQMSLGER